MNFPDLEEISGLVSTEYEREFIRTEYGPGLSYYLNRLDRLMFSGGHVLDAGCGVGQWSVALSQRFARVEAVDLNPFRLAVLKHVVNLTGIENIGAQRGSIEHLPYPDNCFDAVFCYGTVMFTDMDQSLAEFFRVIRPGSRVYVCLNADGWSRYLIEARGPSDEQARVMGQTTLYNTYWRRAIENGMIPSLREKLFLLQGVIGKALPLNTLFRLIPRSAARLHRTQVARKMAQILLCHSRGGMELWDAVQKYCGEDFTPTLLDDVWAIIWDLPTQFQGDGTRAIQPNELESMAVAAGFADFQWSEEAGLVCNWLLPPVEPKYKGTYDKDLAVWECLFVKPEPNHVVVSVEGHIQGARRARDLRLYQGVTSSPILSNRSRWTYPRHLFEHAQDLAEKLGGDAYLQKLAHLLTEEAKSEEDAVRDIIGFVQRAVFRDPVSQPLTATGAIPNALTILLCARGRCGHTSQILLEMFAHAGFEARLRQFPSHTIAEVKVGGRWVIADADAFKNGVVPINRQGRLLAMDEIFENPFQLDRFPATGWFMRPESMRSQDASGARISGYVDALNPDQRGYVSGYYVTEAQGYPPSVPGIVRFEAKEGHFCLEWAPSTVRSDRLAGYRVLVGTISRGWSYTRPGDGDQILQATSTDVLSVETTSTVIEAEVPHDAMRLFASVTAYSSRIEREPQTYFWPSEEAVCEL